MQRIVTDINDKLIKELDLFCKTHKISKWKFSKNVIECALKHFDDLPDEIKNEIIKKPKKGSENK